MAIAGAAVLVGSLASSVTAQEEAAFDLDTGNAVVELIYGPYEQALRASATPTGMDATLIVDSALIVETAWFDAIAPYNATAVGVFSDLGRRPERERTTRNRNIAVLYAAYHSLSATLPAHKEQYRAMLRQAGLDPDDVRDDTTSPQGIGTRAAKAVLEKRKNDGMNRDGSMSGKYNGKPYQDYTGYKPVNTPYELRDPSRWQPAVLPAPGMNGIFTAQTFVTPQIARTRPITYDRPDRFPLTPPTASDHNNREAYKRQADEILQASANLTDEQKMKAELFNDKLLALGVVAGQAAVRAGRFDVEKTVQYVASVDISIFDVIIVSWHYKTKYDTVRPFSAIRHLYGDKKVTAWGGPGKGTVNDLPGREWTSYLAVSDHPEYPSGSSSMCESHAQAARRFIGGDKIEITLPKAKGSSLVEPGVTPKNDITLRWDSWTSFAKDCRMSRVWGGVHFRAATENVMQYGPKVGDLSYEFIQRKIQGR
ncbi:hypothetical protein ETD83_28365 [Actinomadura soli]|uniref:Vanadium-dependent haloperoxidase n=1 Tax=Actinomadura soli TaxID=2508997 RepID=A0A5C4J571_9ACTN|nr:hypothetical protein [Actinomadura soli]TMQ92007.1 hypothetical protein ETD83_28365 [Actinomadura soli]